MLQTRQIEQEPCQESFHTVLNLKNPGSVKSVIKSVDNSVEGDLWTLIPDNSVKSRECLIEGAVQFEESRNEVIISGLFRILTKDLPGGTLLRSLGPINHPEMTTIILHFWQFVQNPRLQPKVNVRNLRNIKNVIKSQQMVTFCQSMLRISGPLVFPTYSRSTSGHPQELTWIRA